MRKVIGATLLSGLIFSVTYAGDFLANVSNGVLSDSSVGVHKLNTAEMETVRGGYTVPNVYIEFANMNSGGGSFAQVGKIIVLSRLERNARALSYYGSENAGHGYTAMSRYQEAVSIANPDRNEVLSITASMAKIPSYWGTPRLKFGFGAAVLRIAPNGTISKVRSATLSSHIATDAMRHEKNNLSHYLVTHYWLKFFLISPILLSEIFFYKEFHYVYRFIKRK